MGILQRFDPPAYLTDFNGIPGQPDAWHRAVSKWFDDSIDRDRQLVGGGTFQFYNPARLDPAGTIVEQAITWNAFPKELLRLYGRERAMREADTLWSVDRYYSDFLNVRVDPTKFPKLFQTLFRPQDEYCEWHVVRDPETNQILRVTFTSEPPEFWHALFGGKIPDDDNEFPGDRDVLLSRYRELASPDVQLDDLIAKEDIRGPGGSFALKGHYNPYNKWNTTHGIVHLGAPPNSLTAEIQLGADATVLHQDSRGRLLVEADALICCAGYGGPDRNSDPTIGASVNALARLGAYVTLRNPVGLYMDHIDLAGWEGPRGEDVSDCVRTLRGMPQMIERLVVEVPKDRGFCVSDICIAGVPIQYGGQIAECITVKLVGVANVQKNAIVNSPASCDGRCCIDVNNPSSLKRPIPADAELPPGTRAAYVNQGEVEIEDSKGVTLMEAKVGAPKAASRPRRPSIGGARSRAYFE
jgi:hypothetical protein